MATPAAFAFKSYTFTNVEMNMGLFSDQSPLDLSFSPSGIFDPTTSTYRLRFAFTATQGEGVNVIVKIINNFYNHIHPLTLCGCKCETETISTCRWIKDSRWRER